MYNAAALDDVAEARTGTVMRARLGLFVLLCDLPDQLCKPCHWSGTAVTEAQIQDLCSRALHASPVAPAPSLVKQQEQKDANFSAGLRAVRCSLQGWAALPVLNTYGIA